MPLTLDLSQITQADVAQVGLKAAVLGTLARAGLAVPPGFVLTAEAYRSVLLPLEAKILSRAKPEDISDPISIEDVATEIRAWIDQAAWPPPLAQAFDTALAALDAVNDPTLALSHAARTSMTTEELASAFGSGIQRAFLGLVSPEAVARAASRCWGTPFTSRSLYYRQRKKIKQTSIELGVLVQRLVRADAGGVMFTADPLTNESQVVIVDSVWGLGDPVTGARVTPDRFVVDKASGGVRSERLADKRVELQIAPDGSLAQVILEEARAEAPSLERTTLRDLAGIAREIESRLNGAQEIEWCVSGGHVYVLQSRPIGQRR